MLPFPFLQRSTLWGVALGFAVAIGGIIILLTLSNGRPTDPDEESALIWAGLFIIIGASVLVGSTLNRLQGFGPWDQHPWALATAKFLTAILAITSAVLTPWVRIENWRPMPFSEDGGNWSHLAGMMGNFFAQLLGPIGAGVLATVAIVICALVSGVIAYKALTR